ncbi:MAG TPA: tryptophan halogenase family protein [Steroidobacteraceae bacterium]
MVEAIRNVHRSPLRVVIVGGGTAGWMSAAAIRRRLRPEDYAVTLIESDDIGTVGVGEATLPHIKIFNDMLGLDEAQFMRETRATFKIGIQFCDWDRPGEGYIHPFGAFGEPWGGVEFQHHWVRALQARRQQYSLQDYSYAVVAARNNAFEFPNEDKKSIRSTYAYAYHFDAGLYAAYLRTWALERGVRRIEGQVCDVKRNPTSGDVQELTLKSGERIAGDLFIDCSGFRSLLLGGVMEVAWRDWTHWLPCDRALAMPTPRSAGALTPYTRSTARRGGWMWRIPLQHRTGNGYVFSSQFISEDDARDELVAALGGTAPAQPRLLRFSPGRREHAWRGNCVAIGLASGFLEPLESTSIYLIQAAVTDLINLMPRPGAAPDPRLMNEFNRLNDMQYERIRDFLVLHYTANRRIGEPLWDYVRSMPLPDSLAHKLALFRARATVPNYHYGLFARDSWLSVLLGQGIMPEGHDRLADAFPIDTLEERLAELRGRIQTNVDAMTAHGEFIANYCGPAETMASEKVAV